MSVTAEMVGFRLEGDGMRGALPLEMQCTNLYTLFSIRIPVFAGFHTGFFMGGGGSQSYDKTPPFLGGLGECSPRKFFEI